MGNKLFFVFILVFAFSCSSDYTPKPKGYPRIDLAEATYSNFTSECPFSFDQNTTAFVSRTKEKTQDCWFNIDYGQLQCRIHLSYKAVDGDLNQLLEDSRALVYKHTIKASAIGQEDLVYKDKKVYAKIFEIDGDAASSVQFYATDSAKHFLRGALYFNTTSNSDSLKPAIDYVRLDVRRLVETLTWIE